MAVGHPTVSIVLGVVLFREHYNGGPAAIAGGLVGFAVMCAGVVALTRTAPATMQPAHTEAAPT